VTGWNREISQGWNEIPTAAAGGVLRDGSFCPMGGGGMMQAEALQRAMAHYRAGQFDAAIRLYRNFLHAAPDRHDVRINLGAALSSQGAIGEAIAELRTVLAAQPDSPAALNNLGSALHRAGKQNEAMDFFRRAILLQPNYADACNNLGIVLMERASLDEAAAQFRRALDIDRAHADAAFNLGNIFLFQERPREAIAQYETALALRPGFARARYNLGTALCRLDRVEEGFLAWTASALAIHGSRRSQMGCRDPHVADHARQQYGWLAERHDEPWSLPRLIGGARLTDRALNPLDGAAITHEWKNAKPKFAVIDDALSPAALADLQAFCMESSIWSSAHRDGYVIAAPEDGMACPLMAQVITELRAALPEILGTLSLHYIAGFKYAAGKGSDVHADSAAVNINLWVTPDEANLEPGRGGLQVWDLVSPGDPQLFNGDTVATRALLEKSGARPTIVPYRCNRMVVFDSDLFHETDQFLFRDSYADRRVNITMLFGHR
jgi:tetratricopeptide (TPR) repeat protein